MIGLEASTPKLDTDSFVALCGVEFQIRLNIVLAKRPGSPVAGKIHPLFVVPSDAERVHQLTSSAKLLR
jgi:hypothetical protein